MGHRTRRDAKAHGRLEAAPVSHHNVVTIRGPATRRT